MNKISSTGLNLVSKSVKENIEQTKSIQKEIINNQQDIIKDSKSLSGNFISDVSNALNNVAKAQSEAAEVTKNYELGKEQDLTKVIVLVLVIIFTVLVYGLFDLIGAKRSILKGYV